MDGVWTTDNHLPNISKTVSKVYYKMNYLLICDI